MKLNLLRLSLLPVTLLACAATLQAAEVTITAPDSPLLRFALGKLEAALQPRGDTLKRVSNLGSDQTLDLSVTFDPGMADGIEPEGFRLARQRNGRMIAGGDERGAMYGLLDVAEQIRMGTPWNKIQDRTVKAKFEFRAIKFNFPWSAYRTSPALEQHRDTCKDLKYWEAFLDMMAENRFNVLSLWSMHPYTYMIRPKHFPEACGFNDIERAEWKKLWSGIFAMAKERGIETYLLNWNIFVSPEFSRAHNVAPWSVSLSHIDKETDTTGELVVRYTKEVVTQVLDEYPDLTGLGITLGERMGGMTPNQRRKWLDDTFFAGIAEAKRPTKFIYRAPLSANMRNEDMYILRWGQPDFVRSFIQRQDAKEYVAGASIGSECYIPALDYITKQGPHKNWSWAFQRQWLFSAVWGNLLYDPATPDSRFEAMLEARFGKGTGKDLLAAWKLASQVPLHFASFRRGTWDGSLYTEGFSSWTDKDDGARTFFDIDSFIQHPVLDTKRYVNIADFVKAGGVAGPGKLSPLALAEELDRDAAEALQRVATIRAQAKATPTLECELTDIEAWSAYGSYFAEKLRGGVALSSARASGELAEQRSAIAALEKALVHWNHLAEHGAKFNHLSKS